MKLPSKCFKRWRPFHVMTIGRFCSIVLWIFGKPMIIPVSAHLKAVYPPISVPFTIDVTTGDKITPAPIEYDYPKLFDDGSIRLFAYPLETVLAEKLETVISRGVTNTRPRDFYDIHVLWRLHGGECNIHTLRAALDATCEKRGSVGRVLRWERVFDEVENDSPMQSLWQKYIQRNAYAA